MAPGIQDRQSTARNKFLTPIWLPMVMLRSLLLQRPSLSSDVLSCWTRCGSGPRSGAAASRATPTLGPVSTVIFLAPRPFLDHTVFLPSSFYHPRSVDSHRSRNLIQGASTLPTFPTSAWSFRYSPNLASRTLSHCAKTSGRATPARQHGRLSTQALTCTGSEM